MRPMGKDQGMLARAPRWRAWMAVAAAAAIVAACDAPGGRTDYVEPDSGAPASAPDASTAEMIGPDSGSGTGGRTGGRAMAGDTTAARGMPAGATDSATKAALDSAESRRRGRPDSVASAPPPA